VLIDRWRQQVVSGAVRWREPPTASGGGEGGDERRRREEERALKGGVRINGSRVIYCNNERIKNPCV
jgi:hypothetical protein